MHNKIVVVLALFISTPTLANEFTVTKVQGNRALITFPKDTHLQPGSSYKIDDGKNSGENSSPYGSSYSQKAKRSYSVSGKLEFTSLKTSVYVDNTKTTANTADNNYKVGGSFGFNFGLLEVGPEVILEGTSVSSVSTTTFGFGPFFDINFIPNQVGNNIIPGIGITANYMAVSSSATVGTIKITSTATGFGGSAGVFGKFFLTDTINIRLDLGYGYESISAIASTEMVVSGLVAKVGFGIYF